MSGKEEGKDGEKKVVELDPRVVMVNAKALKFFSEGVSKGQDKLIKSLAEPESAEKVLQLLNNPDMRVLSFYESGGVITVSAGLPKKQPKGVTRQLVVIKPSAGKVEKPAMELLYNEVGGGEPLEYLQRMLGVYVPILANPGLGLGDVTSSEVNTSLHNFLYSVTTTVGHVKGETSLPLPPLDQASTRSLTAKERIHLLEGCVSVWTRQIKFVLNMDPEASLKSGAHPTPDADLAFWRNKAAQLEAVFEQLQSERLRRVLQYLDSNASTFCEPFAKLCKEVFAARGEAKDNAKFLGTVEGYVRQLNDSSDFGDLPALFRPLLHTLLLIWRHSKFYNTPARLVVFMRQVSNSILAAGQRFLVGKTVTETLMGEDAGTMVPKIQTLLRVAGEFKRVYFHYKGLAAQECPGNPWRISNIALFSRLDAFLERCHDVLEVATVVITYRQLEKVVIGGIKGKALTETTDGVYAEFKAALAALDAVPYDILDCDAKEFVGDLAAFRSHVAVLDRRLATILVSAFEDAPNLYGRFKLLETYHVLLERPLIADELERLHLSVVREFGRDLRQVHEAFLSERAAPPIANNLPPIAGALVWNRALRDRVSDPMARIKTLSREILTRDESREVIALYSSFITASEQFDAEQLVLWGSDLERSSDEKLRLFLLKVKAAAHGEADSSSSSSSSSSGGEGGELPAAAAAAAAMVGGGGSSGEEGKEGEEGSVAAKDVCMLDTNFDSSLVRMLREVKYFLLMGLEVPPSALQIYMKAETYRRWTGSLDVIVGMHNTVLEEMLPVEVPLLISHLNRMNAVMVRGLKELNWKSPAVEGFIGEAMSSVKTCYDILYVLKQSLREIVHEMEGWSREPLLTRKAKPMPQEELEMAYRVVRTARYASITEGGKMVQKKLKEMEMVLKLPKTSSKDWGVYVDFVNGIVVQGLQKLVTCSLQKLCDMISPEKIKRYMELPLLVIDLTLNMEARALVYKPDVHERLLAPGMLPLPASQQSVYDIVNNWVQSFYHVAKCFKRMDDNEGRYLKEIMDDLEVKTHLASLAEFLARAEASCLDFRTRFDAYSFLWTKTMPEELAAFVERSYYELPKTEEQLAEEANAEANVARLQQPKVPDLAKFEAEIMRYSNLGEVLANFKTPVDLAWIRVNSAPVKAALASLITSWSACFVDHLQEVLVTRMNDLAAFISATNDGLDVEVADGDSASLMKVMGVLLEVKQSRYYRKAMVAPLRNIFKLLKRNGAVLDEVRISGPGATSGPGLMVEYLDQAELLLHAAVNRSFSKKEQIYPMQTAELERIKHRVQAFDESIRTFWGNFRKNAPYNFAGPVAEAYQQLDGFFKELVVLEKGAEDLNVVEALFELPVSKFNETQQCRGQLRLLKSVWDFKGFVLSTYDSWRLGLWHDINTDALEDSNKKMAAELKKLGEGGPMVKAWQLYKDVEVMVKDMATTLPLINELHSPAMRPRHWAALASVCNVKSLDPTDSKFCLDDMLALRLHTHAEEASEIVDTANKELKIEKKMDEIETAWKAFNLDFVQWKDMELKVVKASDEVQESLDAHQMELQSIVGMGKVMEFFRDRVELQQKNLGCVEEVLKEWLSVTRNWGSLEVIFLASADIRAQLPEETKTFEGIDSAFKELMKAAVETTNVVESCTKEGRGDALKGMTKDLETCQRKLNDYLDKKKKIYPRFYFVSNVALLDILSNGNNPPKIMPYTGDCYDSISNLLFAPPPADLAPDMLAKFIPNQATAMVAKDGETVPFHKPFIIAGPVENWLNELTEMQINCLRTVLEQAMETAVHWDSADKGSSGGADKPRHYWVEDYCAQIVLVGTQIYWTEEAQRSLDELEGGQEDAVKKYLGVCNDRLLCLIQRVLGDLDRDLRNKIIALITIDVHARDVMQKLIDTKAEGPSSFLWSQQLRFYWQADNRDVNIAITDFRSKYSYEYLGNSGRLVITPLTDRCYITLTLALRLFLGGAPAGPAGTGKTETTKDLARAVALPCYVFNCSDQMNYQTMADIFKGLAQTGAWGCFDEFNRIMIEVLSVVATQVKQVLDAAVLYSIPSNREAQYQGLPAGSPPNVVGTFELNGDTIKIIPTVGMFITMNPGYAGRTELPENLKALFRSCAMIRPDLALICENMLMSEGFASARPLSIKFVTLYELSSALLSPQAHYDWGLRSVKSVLRVAGSLKRLDKDIAEDGILMRALRDFNTPKMPLSDLPIFLRLIQDLFPKYYNLPTKLSVKIQQNSIQACKEAKPQLQADNVFISKVVQLQELMDVRHSVMLLGPGGCGKTTVWKTLCAGHNLGLSATKAVAIYNVVDPKAITSDELYGYMTLAKEWKDGCLSIIMRGMSKNNKELGYTPAQTFKWAVLDGDIDAVWIESMNTVMDDNKMLTLVSNERIPLSAAMRMVFEINSLANATPATVSRAGILYINESDIGWRPMVDTWLAATKMDELVRLALPGLFDKYVEALSLSLDFKRLKASIPIMLISQVSTVIRLLEGFMEKIGRDTRRPVAEVLEQHFYLAVAWAFGGSLTVEASEGARGDHRRTFHEMLANLSANCVRLPKIEGREDALVFDFFFDPEAEDFRLWSDVVSKYVTVPIGSNQGEQSFSSLVVPTVDSTRLTSLAQQLTLRGYPVMFVGTAGTGKTTLVKSYLASLSLTNESLLTNTITMNYYMDSKALQERIDSNIDKRSGKVFGPPNGKRLILYIDDFNLPYIETYGTQNSLSLLRQIIDHKIYYDRIDLGYRKEVADLQFMASMNPTAGSFTVTERLQRNFSTFSCLMPSDGDLGLVYKSILAGHFVTQGFSVDTQSVVDGVVSASIRLLRVIIAEFLPDAERFMYNWNMRELANIFQGLTLARSEMYPLPIKMVRLWIHESFRVFSDRMVDLGDYNKFEAKVKAVAKVAFKDMDQEALFEGPIIFTNFAAQPGVGGDPAYISLPAGEKGMEVLSKTLMEKLDDYNSSHSIMELVLFEQAMEHVCRIARIISNPGGHALLVGVGGSGKQSLSKLSAHICNYEVKQLAVTSRFTVNDLKDALKGMYQTTGVKGNGLVFLLTDSQIVNDKFLVCINDILSSGWISDLFERDEIDAMFNAIRNDAKAAGVQVDDPSEMLKFFLIRTRALFHIVLCFSPVGATFRVRARRFPGLINCTAVDKFHPWPREALMSVANRFIEDVDLVNDTIKTAVAQHMAELHVSVTEMSVDFREKMRRYNYVTPKSFLELIAFYRFLLGAKREVVGKNIKRLDDGLAKLKQTSEDVAELKIDVAKAMVKAEEEVKQTDILVAQMTKQTEEANVEKEKADLVAADAKVAADAAAVIKEQAAVELAEAQPAMEAAMGAVQGLDQASLSEFGKYKQALPTTEWVTGACAMMLDNEFKKAFDWPYAQKMMKDAGGFKKRLEDYANGGPSKMDGAKRMSDALVTALADLTSREGFDEKSMKGKSSAAANLCKFVLAIYKFNRIYVKVEPLMMRLEQANNDESRATAAKNEALAKVALLNESLAALQAKFEEANAKKMAAEAFAKACNDRLDLANRLVGGLSSENERWGIEVERLKRTETMLIGDTLLGAAFVSYIGAFNNVYRKRLWAETWTPDLVAKGVPMSESSDPMDMLTDEGKNAKMMSEGLPADRISLENGAIITSCKRWPLIIDPQLQGIKWLKKREADNKLMCIQLSQPTWIKNLLSAIQQGNTIIIENVGEDLDATLDPVLSRAVFSKGRTMYLRMGGEEVEYDARFKLFLQTKLANPHYRPEVQAQCTIVNFIATESGLQDQLLARVVQEERSDLEKRKEELSEAFNSYKLQLLELEDNLLSKLANAPADILSDVELIYGLEATKAASIEINAAVAKGKQTEQEINLARQVYVPTAEEGAMLYFTITTLNALSHMYQYSLDSFVLYFYKAIRETPKADELKQRVENLKETMRLVIYTWVARGLAEADKLILMSQLTFTLMARGKLKEAEEWSSSAFQFLLRGPKVVTETVPPSLADWMPESAWQTLSALGNMEGGEFSKLPSDIVEAPARFKEWFNHVTPETEKLPLNWAALDKTPMKKLLVLRSMRPDRVTVALRSFVALTLPSGSKFTELDGTLNSLGVLEETLKDATTTTPLFFILSPGADVVGDLDKVAKRLGYEKGVSYHNVSMGQGQDVVALDKMNMAHRQGHWVILNNVHLMPKWLTEVEKKLDAYALEGSHERFRFFLTSAPSNDLPIGMLNRSIKLTNEPPQGLKANLKRAFCIFTPEFINELDTKLRAIVFGLSFFHAVVIERKKFGSKGYNMMYPFALGDLRDSVVCLQNYMENSSGRVPWEDLRYIFGEIMYGGHVVNDFDRLLVNNYLEHFLKDELLEEMELFPFNKDEKASFKSCNPTTFDRYLEHIDTQFPSDTPVALGLHPNAAIQTASEASDSLMRQLLELQPRDAGAGGGDEKTPRMIATLALQDIMDAVADVKWDLDEFMAEMAPEDVGPFQNVLILEIKGINTLTAFMRRSLATLKLGFEGRLTMSESMEALELELSLDRVPASWVKLAWPSLRMLGTWKANLMQRVAQLGDWRNAAMELPRCLWLGGLINPQSYLTAIKQIKAQRESLELDRLTIQTDVLKRSAEDVEVSRDGAHITGLYITGATFDATTLTVEKSKPRQMETLMPVVNVRSVLLEKLDLKGVFQCPVYKTQQRGPTYVFSAQLKTKSVPARWVMAGACCVFDKEG